MRKKGTLKQRIEHTLSNTPEIFSSLYNAAIWGLNVLRAANDGERHCVCENASVLRARLVFGVNGRLIDADALSNDDLPNLEAINVFRQQPNSKPGYTYSLLEHKQIVLRQRVRFCNDRNQVNACTQSLHNLDVERLEPKQG